MLNPYISLRRSEKDPENENSKQLTVYRIILFLVISFSYLLRYLFLKNDFNSYDPLLVRELFSCILVLLLVASFFKYFTSKVLYAIYVVFFVYTLYALFLIYKNGFSINYTLELILLSTIFCMVLKTKLHINLYLISIFLIYSFICLLLVHSLVDVAVQLGMMVVFCAAVGTFFYTKINFEKRLDARDQLLNTIFNSSPDAMIIFDPESMLITNCNQPTIGMFKKDSENSILGKDINSLYKYPHSKSEWQTLRREIEKTHMFEAEFKISETKSFWGSAAITEIKVSHQTFWLLRITNITEKVRDKKIIEENRKMLREIVNLVPHAIYLKDHKARLIFFNKAYTELVNHKPEDLLGKTDIEILNHQEAVLTYGDDLEVIQKGVEKFINAEEVTDKTGITKIVQTTKIPFYLERKKRRGLLGIGIDITERVKDKETIDENRKMLMEIINILPHPIYLRDNEGKILLANEAYALMHNMGIAEIIGKTYSDILIPEYAERFEQMEKEIIKEGNVKFFPEEISTDLKGNIRIMNVIKIPFYLSLKKTTGILAVSIDITKSKMSEKALKDNERKFRALIENASDIIIILNEDFVIKFVGPSINRILGYDTEVFVGKSVYEFIHQDERELTAQFLSDTLQKPGENQMVKEILIKNSEGKYLFFEIVVVNMLTDPIINGIIMNGHNITERKMTESELINTNFELDSFVYKASHDLKAPLRSMMGLIKLAKLESKDPNLGIYLDMMNKSIINLDVFIKDLTQFSRNSRMEIESKEINFEQIISEALNNLKYMENADKVIINKKIDIQYKFCSDITRVSTIINNLISNAFKYHRIENNSPYINILITADRGKCQIIVEDNGAGIDPSHIGKIYEMFYRASESSYGSGLGLYIVKSAVSKLNGTIDVESEVNKGSKFIVIIPNLLEEHEG